MVLRFLNIAADRFSGGGSGLGDDTVQGGAGNDAINLSDGGADVVSFQVVVDDNRGGNGLDMITGFGADDRLDLSALLDGNQNARNIGDYLTFTSSAGNTTISIDRDAGGGTYAQSDLVVIIGQVIAEDDLTFLTNNLII
jgi:hypothetical protein